MSIYGILQEQPLEFEMLTLRTNAIMGGEGVWGGVLLPLSYLPLKTLCLSLPLTQFHITPPTPLPSLLTYMEKSMYFK